MTSSNSETWYSQRDISTTLVKGIKVLSAFDDGALRMTLPEIGQKTGYDRATVRRLVITLVDMGLLVKADKSFSLTPKILTLASGYARGHGIGTTVQPILNKYSEQLGKEISLATLSEGAALYLARSSITGSAVSFGFTAGSRLPLLHTAVGRMLLATQSVDGVDAYISSGDLTQYTAHTLMDPAAIQREVEAARSRGFALVTAEFEAGITGIAVPVGRIGVAKTVIGVSGPAATLYCDQVHASYLGALQLCAAELDRVWDEGP